MCRRRFARLAVEIRARSAGREGARGVELVEHDARLDPGPALGGVHFEDLVQILRGIELQARPDRLAGLRGAAAAGGNRDVVSGRDLHRPHDILARPRDDHSRRFHAIDAGIGGVERSRYAVESHISADAIVELLLKAERFPHRAG